MKKLPFNFQKISMLHIYIFIILYGFARSLETVYNNSFRQPENHVFEIFTFKPYQKTEETEVKEIQPIYSESGLSLNVKIKKSNGVEETKRYSNIDPITFRIIMEKILKNIDDSNNNEKVLNIINK